MLPAEAYIEACYESSYLPAAALLMNVCWAHFQVRWLQMLSNNAGISEVPRFSDKTNSFLEDTLVNFGVADALLVKKVERTTNHDVKAIEYVLKDKFRSDAELTKVRWKMQGLYYEVCIMGPFQSLRA